jgi:hypothetical protein
MSSSWDLIVSGDYLGAVAATSEEIARRPSMGLFANRATAYILLRDYDKALADIAVSGFLDATDTTWGDSAFCWFGAVLWLKHAYWEATRIWQFTVRQMVKGRFTHSDAAGGVGCGCLLWFASQHFPEATFRADATELLEKKLMKRSGKSWPGPIASFILQETTAEQLRAAVSETPVLRERQLCRAEFFIGAALLRSNSAEALECFDRAVGFREAILEEEYFLAQHEAERLRRGGT